VTATFSRSGSAHSLLSWWPLAALAGATILLGAVEILPRWPGLVHAVALPPLDVAFDVRVLMARASSYPLFAIGALVSVTVRSLILAALLGALGFDQPYHVRLRRTVGFYLIAWIPVTLAAGLSFAALAALYHWYFWMGLGVLLVTSAALMPVLFRGSLRIRWMLVYLFFLTLTGGLAQATGPRGSVALVPVSAAVTLTALNYRTRRRRQAPVGSTAASALALACLIASVGLPPLAAGSVRAQVNPESEAVLFLVPGVDTSSGHGALYRFDPTALGFSCDRVFYYSYLGPGPGAPRGDARCSIRLHAPYGQEDTQLHLETLTAAFARQLVAVRAASDGARVVVVTHSQGNLIAWRGLTSEMVVGVSHLIMLAGFTQNPAPYPPRGDDGSGRVGGDILRGLTGLARRMGVGTFDPDAPLARQILATAGAMKRILSEPLPSGVQALSLAATIDAPLFPGGRSVPGARDEGTVDTTHVGLVTSARTVEVVHRFLAGEPEGSATPLAAVVGWISPACGSPPHDAK
jgi:hypothetical protein